MPGAEWAQLWTASDEWALGKASDGGPRGCLVMGGRMAGDGWALCAMNDKIVQSKFISDAHALV